MTRVARTIFGKTSLGALALLAIVVSPACGFDGPAAVTWHTFLGSFAADSGRAVAGDAAGNLYVGGQSDFHWGSPTRPHGGGSEAFVAKLAPSGAVTWNTFLGGAGIDRAEAIAIDAAGYIYVTGDSYQGWGTPVRAHSVSDNADAFVAKLTPAGELVWNTFLGGESHQHGWGIAVDGDGNVFVCGTAWSPWGTAPIRPFTGSGSTDGWVAKLAPDGTLTWHTFLGDEFHDELADIATDPAGNAYVIGESQAPWGSPIRPHQGNYDAMVAKLAPTGVLLWHTFLGGTVADQAAAVAADATGVYAVGTSAATWGSPLQAYVSRDAFLARLTDAGLLSWNTFAGGSSTDQGRDVTIATDGDVYVGVTAFGTWGMPEMAHQGSDDFALLRYAPAGDLLWHTFVGSTAADFGTGIAVTGDGTIHVAGSGSTAWSGTPLQAPPGGGDVFAAEIAEIPPTPTATSTPDDTATATASATATETPPATASDTPTPPATTTDTPTPLATATASATATDTPPATATASASATATSIATESATPTAIASATSTPSSTATLVGSTPTPTASGCPAVPVIGCRDAGRHVLQARGGGGAADSKLLWKWNKGTAATLVDDLGDPLGGATSYRVCLYDQNAGNPRLALDAGVAAGGQCGSRPCWKAIGGSGWSYRNLTGNADGITKLLIRAGTAGRPKLQLKAAGASLPLTAPVAGDRFFDSDPAVIVQLHASDPPTCWTSLFADPTRNDGIRFKATAP